MSVIEETVRKIKALEIQGATNVALSSLEAIIASRDLGVDELKRGIEKLKNARPTEPLAINTLSYLLSLDSAEKIRKEAKRIHESIKKAMEEVIEIGSRLLPERGVVQTICHSSTVVNILTEARDEGKEIRAVVTETRPRYQGRKTAWELYTRGVPVVLYVDSAMLHAMKKEKVDMVLTGLDAIFVDGSIANKIGTGLLALAAEASGVPFYSAGLALKLDYGSKFAESVEIEERDPREVWNYPIDIRNPAFEVVPARRIRGIITELGVLPPQTVYSEVTSKYREIFRSLQL